MVTALLLVLAAQTTAPTPCRVAVFDFENQGLAANEAHLPAVLMEAAASAIADASGCQVITKKDMASMVEFEAERAACGAGASDSCLAEIGAALGVERMVTGSVARVATSTTVTARLMNLKTGVVDARAEATTDDVAALRGLAQRVGTELILGKPSAAAPSSSTEQPGGGGAFVVGAVVAGVGALAAVGGAVGVGFADGVLADKTTSRAEKDSARGAGQLAGLVAAAGAVVLVVGGVVALVGGE
jgi:TolB-like protein